MNKKQILSAILCALGIAAAVFIVINYEAAFEFLGKLFKILRPIFIGGAVAFILNRPLMKIHSLYMKLNSKFKKRKIKKEKTVYTLSLITVYVLFIALIAGIVWFIVPQLVSSADFFKNSFDTYYKNFIIFAETHFGNINSALFEEWDITGRFYEWFNNLAKRLPQILTATFGWTANLIGTITDIFLGLIVSVYILADKKKLRRQTGDIFMAVFSEKTCEKIRSFYVLCSNTFAGFIGGQLTEALILGALCFLGMNVFGFDYSVLISVIIGLTNLVPIFGPILGTIPCALILLLVNPTQALWFVIFVIVLQQVESNLIYPRVVGSSVGLAPIWTLTAIIIGGGLFGVLGMLFGIPAMSVIYTTIGTAVRKRLETKKIPT